MTEVWDILKKKIPWGTAFAVLLTFGGSWTMFQVTNNNGSLVQAASASMTPTLNVPGTGMTRDYPRQPAQNYHEGILTERPASLRSRAAFEAKVGELDAAIDIKERMIALQRLAYESEQIDLSRLSTNGESILAMRRIGRSGHNGRALVPREYSGNAIQTPRSARQGYRVNNLRLVSQTRDFRSHGHRYD